MLVSAESTSNAGTRHLREKLPGYICCTCFTFKIKLVAVNCRKRHKPLRNSLLSIINYYDQDRLFLSTNQPEMYCIGVTGETLINKDQHGEGSTLESAVGCHCDIQNSCPGS